MAGLQQGLKPDGSLPSTEKKKGHFRGGEQNVQRLGDLERYVRGSLRFAFRAVAGSGRERNGSRLPPRGEWHPDERARLYRAARGKSEAKERCDHICWGRKETIAGMLEDGLQGTDGKEPTQAGVASVWGEVIKVHLS